MFSPPGCVPFGEERLLAGDEPPVLASLPSCAIFGPNFSSAKGFIWETSAFSVMPGDELSFLLMKMCVFLWEDLENTDLQGKRIPLVMIRVQASCNVPLRLQLGLGGTAQEKHRHRCHPMALDPLPHRCWVFGT